MLTLLFVCLPAAPCPPRQPRTCLHVAPALFCPLLSLHPCHRVCDLQAGSPLKDIFISSFPESPPPLVTLEVLRAHPVSHILEGALEEKDRLWTHLQETVSHLTPLNRVSQDAKGTGTCGSVCETCAGRSSSRDHSLDEVTCMSPQCLQMGFQQRGGFRGGPSGGPPHQLPGAFIFSHPLGQAEGRRSDCG